MHKLIFIPKLFIAAIVVFISNVSYSQNLISSRQSSALTYFYKLTDKEALSIVKEDIYEVDSTYFHTLVDSYPTDSTYTGKLAPGHYLKTFLYKNKQQIFYTYIPDFDVKILNNNTDLCIQVYSLSGKLITDAYVKAGCKTLRFDSKTQCYTEKKSNKKGILKIVYGGNTAFLKLNRRHNNPALLRETRKVLFSTPLKYVWIPINYVIKLPIDGIKSINKQRPQGVIFQTKYFFHNLGQRIENIFSPNAYLNNYKGYMVFNKPKYHPGDTVKFKAYILNKHAKPLTKNITFTLHNGNKYTKLAELKPYAPGGYEYHFMLHDSLNLKLDRYYNLELENKQRKNYMVSGFMYEDYELNNTKLNLRTESDTQYKGKKLNIYAKGTDDNGLNLLDARLEITVKSRKVSDYFDQEVFVADTLWTTKMELKPSGETEIQIPDSIFPKANIDYILDVRLLTSDNKTYSQSKNLSYYYSRKTFEINLIADSLLFSYNDNNIPEPTTVNITATDNFGNSTHIVKTKTPCKLPLNVFYSSYTIKSDSLQQTFNLNSKASLLQCFTQRTKDSVFIDVDNPRKLKFTYNIYKRNTEKLRGSGDSLSYHKSISTKQHYYISLRYLWGGSIKEETYRIPFFDKKLNISVNQPGLVYPGQKVNMEVTVTDQGGKPVQGVDLTAYSLTKKFDYSAPTLPYLGKYMPEKELINNFKFVNEGKDESFNLAINYEKWGKLAGIDSIEYYKFIYPGNKIYREEYRTSDGITQFAPFVMSKNGDFEPIHIIYIDSKPVYFSWSTNRQPYSFRVDSGYHQIRLRTNNKDIIINKFRFKLNCKTIFSLRDDLSNKNVTITKAPNTLNQSEKNIVNRYIFPYRNNFGENFAYLEDGNNIQLLNPNTSTNYRYSYRHFAGPAAGSITVGIVDGYSTNFNPEENFEYELSPQLIKMRELSDDKLPSANILQANIADKNLSDTVYTQSIMKRELKSYLDMKRRQKATYRNPYNTTPGYGKLIINNEQTKNDEKNLALNTVFLRYDADDFIRVYPGSTKSIEQLKPGLYKMISFYPGAYYQVTDYITVKANGTTYFKLKNTGNLKKDSFSLKVSNLIETTIFGSGTSEYVKNDELNQIHNYYMQQYQYTGTGLTISGKIYDQKTGDPIIGATVVVKGTNYGTVTNIEGVYSFKIPSDKHIIRIAYIGYITEEIDLQKVNTTSFGLKEDAKALSEVVVVAYGMQKKSSLTGSISTVSTQSLSGIITVNNALQGKIAGADANFMVRGTSSMNPSQAPLYVVDGSVYTGDISKIDPAQIASFVILKDAQSTAIYGARGVNGVILITTNGNGLKTSLAKEGKGASYDQTFLEAASKANSIRSNFSDYAFWQPHLTTNKKGKASFTTTFPDDVTSWQTFVLAMNGKKQSGQTSGNIKSYKPLMAQLAVPNFLVENDSAIVIGKALNYLPDSVQIKTSFEINTKNTFSKSHFCVNSSIDSLQVVAPSDSLTLRYSLTKNEGYFDGEQRKVPVYPIGLEETKGSFYVLDNESTITPAFDTANGDVTLYAHADYLNIINDEISHLINYKYYCNEQIASKLKALLAERMVAQYSGKKVKNDTEIEKLIRLLMKNRKADGLWGWWKDSETHYEFSAHILEALYQARKQGFKIEIDDLKLAQQFVSELETKNHNNVSKDILILKVLKTYNCAVDYKGYIGELDKIKKKDLASQLNLIELKQICGLPYQTDTLKAIQQSTMFGNVFFRDDKLKSGLMGNDIQNTLIAYRIIRNINANDTILSKVRRYLLEKKQSYCWWNTYESAQIVETILPDILKNGGKWKKSELILSGDITQTIEKFPFELKLKANQKVSIRKTGNDPVYLTTYQHNWNKNPKTKNGDFIINTHFDNTKGMELKAGKATKLIVNLDVLKDADYVMLEIPIPAGCSYGEKTQYYRNEVHREYFRNETNIFCQKLRKGSYTFEINLVPRFNGKYTLNPAKAELMYFPVFNANNELKKVSIR